MAAISDLINYARAFALRDRLAKWLGTYSQQNGKVTPEGLRLRGGGAGRNFYVIRSRIGILGSLDRLT